jgi:hypothetical protein
MLDAIPSPVRLTWPASSVAHALGISEATFRLKRAELEAKHGFPCKLPGFNAWSQWAVVHWINSNGGTYGAASAPVIPNDDPEIDRIVGGLESEYGAPASAREKAVA